MKDFAVIVISDVLLLEIVDVDNRDTTQSTVVDTNAAVAR